MNYDFLQLVIQHLQSYEAQADSTPSATHFAEWILHQDERTRFSESVSMQGEEYPDLAAIHVSNSRFIINLYRYAKTYAKKAIPSESPITFEDYSYLVMLYYTGKMSKKQLIDQNIHEKSTGMEVIKRLLRLGLVTQEDNIADKRSKLVFLTAHGKSSMEAIQQNMYALAVLVNGNLSSTEITTLFHLLQKLDLFHQSKV